MLIKLPSISGKVKYMGNEDVWDHRIFILITLLSLRKV